MSSIVWTNTRLYLSRLTDLTTFGHTTTNLVMLCPWTWPHLVIFFTLSVIFFILSDHKFGHIHYSWPQTWPYLFIFSNNHSDFISSIVIFSLQIVTAIISTSVSNVASWFFILQISHIMECICWIISRRNPNIFNIHTTSTVTS